MKGYLFISNSEKPTEKQFNSLEPISIESFDGASFYAARELGYELFKGISRSHPEKIVCSTPGYNITYYDEHIYRNIFAFKDNYIAFKNCCQFIKKHSEIKVIHCNTPIGGVIGRLVGRKYGKKVIYTVHGFHFYNGAPLINWLVFYPIEKLLLRFTDVLITINSEDFSRAQKYQLRNGGNVYYIPGVGIDLNQLSHITNVKVVKRNELKIPVDATVIISVGRLDRNKNHALTIKAISKIKSKNVHFIICGDGREKAKLQSLVDKLNLNNQVHLLGNREDVIDLYNASDIFALSSYREGLSRAIMEAMRAGLPCVVTKIRGNIDLVQDGKGGFCVFPDDVENYAKYLDILCSNKKLREEFSEYNLKKITNFSKDTVEKIMLEIFKKEL